MILGILAIIATASAGFLFLSLAERIARNDIKAFVKITIVTFAMLLILGIYSQAHAEPLTVYIGAESGLDWSHDGSTSPQCEQGGRDQLTSDGRFYVGASQPIGIVTFYTEFDGWRHKSCALVEDSLVYDAYGVKFGARVEFNLPF